MLGFARNIVFFWGKRGSVAEKRPACATVAVVVALPWNLSRTARAVELTVPSDFVSSLLMLCLGTLHVLRHIGPWNRCIQAMRSTISCVAISLCCAIQSVQIAMEWLRQGCSKGTCSSVESCDSDCVLQAPVKNRIVVVA